MLLFNLFNDSGKFFRIKKIGLVLGVLTCLTLLSCDNVLPAPQFTDDKDDSAQKAIAIPMDVTASHGQKGQITISWTSVPNAKYYCVYKADSPHNQYIQIDEADGEAYTIVLPVPSGFSGYFKVSAVDSFGYESGLSLAAYGTSLATPQITSIIEDTDKATVNWYMENANSKSYLASVQYAVSCFNPDDTLKQTIILKGEDIVKGAETSVVFENLNSGIVYKYQIEAYLIGNQTDVEQSLKLDSQTAMDLTPKAATFTATEGSIKNTIQLDITLPQVGQILASAGTGGVNISIYEERPLYFKIQRQELIENDNTDRFEDIATYLNYKGFAGDENKLVQIAPEDDKPTRDKKYNEAVDEALNGTLPYTEGTVISWQDTTVKAGIKYQYRVLSYIDCYEVTNITHDKKTGKIQTGWAPAIPNFSAKKSTYDRKLKDGFEETEGMVLDDDNSYISGVTLSFNSTWNDLSKASDYAFLISETRRKLKKDNGGIDDTIGTTSFIENKFFEDLNSVNIFMKALSFTENDDDEGSKNKDNRGYFKYTLLIVPKTVISQYTDPNASINEIKASMLLAQENLGEILITNDAAIPKANIISTESGWCTQVPLEFFYQKNTYYKLQRFELSEDGSADESTLTEIPLITKSTDPEAADPCIIATGVNVNEAEKKASFTDKTVTESKHYGYMIIASTDEYENVPSEMKDVKTLGIPVLSFDPKNADYKTITVEWNKVQEAVNYSVLHNGKTFTVNPEDFIESGKETKDYSQEGYSVTATNRSNYIMVIKNVQDLSENAIDSTKAGKDLVVELSANSGKDSNKSTIDNTFILGPAKIGLEASQSTSKDTITLSWNIIPGINVYAVNRICSNKGSGDPKANVFYVLPSEQEKVKFNGEPVSESRMTVEVSGNKIYLKDKQCPVSDETNSLEVCQSKIQWGLEYTYSVMPVKSMDDNPFPDESGSADFDITYNGICTPGKNNDTNTVARLGYTRGLGININATKADYADNVEITWEAPNSSGANGRLFAKPDGGSWELVTTFDATTEAAKKYKHYLAQGSRTKKIEYIVTYTGEDNPSLPSSYDKYLDEALEANGEKKNEGYEFTLPMFRAYKPTAENESFTEKVEWDLWDTEARKNGPEYYEFYIKNNNFATKTDGWHKIGTLSADGRTFTPTTEDWYDIKTTHEIISNSLSVEALNNGSSFTTTKRLLREGGMADAIAGTHKGLLKVQRDYKHYYKLVAKRTNSKGGTVDTALGNVGGTSRDTKSLEEVMTYRKISDDEFVKGITLIVADALYQAGIDSGGERTVSGSTGKMKFKHPGGKQKFIWGTGDSDYKHIFRSGTPENSSQLTSGWTIKMPDSEGKDACTYNYLGYLEWGTMKVSHENSLLSYQGYVILNAGNGSDIGVFKVKTQKFNLTLQYSHTNDAPANSQKITITSRSDTSYNTSYDKKYTVDNNPELFFKWFPYKLGEDRDSGITSFDSNLPLYSGDWWEDPTK